MSEIFNPEINKSALQEIEKSEYTLPGEFIRGLLESYIDECKKLRYCIDPNYGVGTQAMAWPSAYTALIGEIRANEKVLRELGFDSEVDQVKQKILLTVDRSGLASYRKLWKLLGVEDQKK